MYSGGGSRRFRKAVYKPSHFESESAVVANGTMGLIARIFFTITLFVFDTRWTSQMSNGERRGYWDDPPEPEPDFRR